MPTVVIECDRCGRQQDMETKFWSQARYSAKQLGWQTSSKRWETGAAGQSTPDDPDLCPKCAKEGHMSNHVTEVKISFFKPTGFEDTHYVDTEDRGLAAMIALSQYGDAHRQCLNYIQTRHFDRKDLKEPLLDIHTK